MADVMLSVKSAFFRPDLVTKAADRAKVRVLSKAGAFIRQRARTSIRTRQMISQPGSPPSSHVGTLKRSILFAYDPSVPSVVIGPVPFRGSGQGAKALEEGGAQVVRTPKGYPLRKGRALDYRPRPFMVPALEAELSRALALFKDMIH